MSFKTNFMTSVAAVALMTGAAVAQTETPLDDGQTIETEQSQNVAGSQYAGWSEDLDQRYGTIADTRIAELVGMNVVTEGGDDVGEVDNFVLMEGELRAVVGVGGFLGMGEHEVALPLGELTYDGEKLVISYTKEELEAMPEYTEELEQTQLADDDTFRTFGAPISTAEVDGATGGMDNDADVSGADQPEMASADGETGGDMSAEGDGSAELAGTQTPDAEDNVSIDEMQTAEAGSMEQVEADAPTGEDVAAAEEASEAAGGEGDTVTEEVAEAEEGEIEQEAEELAAEAGQALEDGEQAVETAAAETEAAIEDGAAEAEQMAEDAAAEIEDGASDVAAAATGVAESDADEADAPSGEDVAAAEEASEAAGGEGDTMTEEVAEAEKGEIEQEAEEIAAEAGDAADAAGDWLQKLEGEFAEIAETPLNELEGTDVVTASGEDVGEIDDFGMMNGKPVAIVGVGGFLGLGEHDVALDLANLSWKDGAFVLEGYTEEDLKAMPEYDAEQIEMLEGDVTLRSSAEM